ncbi:M20 family metallo-hydrolase [Histidinibacterium aquaticum]|uniref:M20 family metallo-hydrolase n=1 Tax=Histidinibacterium aquaticum TaxID=2613962 RepID=A0A5J5GHU4_9RHOB|nr:M20 family metallo-hydrolase [Histidinibacterium aquaticum]KAA9007806.1 M20 family metallo-hydrolase [Histidinibacterium aquaticum]
MTDAGLDAAEALASLSEHSEPGPGVTRLPFTPEHRAALDRLTALMESAGLTVSLDAAGTLVGRAEGPPGAPTLLMGSHQDSVREGGAFDGIMGVVLPLLALARLRLEGTALPLSVEVLAFADEEGVRFPTALLGSRALAGTVDPAVLEMADAEGTTLGDALRRFGLDPAAIPGLRRDPATIAGFVETHIEQGPVLEAAEAPLGVVTAICGIERHAVTVTGETGHAGTLPMEGRRDALVAAARIVSEVDRLARAEPPMRGTVGALSVAPGVVNAVPREVRLTAELRSPEDTQRLRAGKALHAACARIATEHGLTVDAARTYAQPAQPCDPTLSDRLAAAVTAVTGSEPPRLPSGATHDASAMADLCPMTMLFVRCRGGISHDPAEYAAPDDMGAAVEALAKLIADWPA